MKKKEILRISCIAIIACLIFSVFPTSTFAADLNNQQISTSQKSSYFDEKTILAYGQAFINDTISFDHTTSWTKNTQPSEIVKTYDTDNNVNAYIINLKTNGKPTGYMLIEAFTSGEPNIMEYGYSGVYYLTDKRFENLKTKKIVYTGNRDFYVESSGQYCNAEDNIKTSLTKENIKNGYLYKARLENQYLAIASATSAKAATLKTMAATSVSATVPYLNKLTPYTMDELAKCSPVYVTNHCGPTAGMNLLKYWAVSRGVVPLFINYDKVVSFTSLKMAMGHTNEKGTYDNSAYMGIAFYISNNKLVKPKGNDFINHSNLSWDRIKTEINHGNPFVMLADVSYYSSQTGNHFFLAVGYLSNSYGTYVRVVDEWNTSTDHFYKYLYSNVISIWYYRWA